MSENSNPSEATVKEVPLTSYVIIANKGRVIIQQHTDYKEATKFLALLRKAGADVSLFKELQA